jgi:phenylacetate-CoA ligase
VNERLLRLYHRLPPALRSVAATWHGWRLRRWRYGSETDRLVEEALERERWSAERWRNWQQERLAYVLHRAATRVPYYRRMWEERRRRGDRSSWELLENWPILEKEEVRRQLEAFLADDCDPRRMYEEHTSGTTGTPLKLWWSRQTVRAWYALFDARWRRWYGVSRRDRWAILGGQLVTPVSQRRPPFWVWNAALNQLYLSSYHLAPDLIPYYLEALERYQVRYLYGYSSSLNALAQEALRRGWRARGLAVVVTNAEPLFEYQRRAIGEAFGCPVRETYGMAEIVAAAGECEHGRLHLWPEVGLVEVLNPDSEGVGELICTGLLNADMPLIRYRVGDRGALAQEDSECACGRRLPGLARIEGRYDDVVLTPDGRQVGRLDPVFKTDLPIREAMIIQEALDRLRVRLVPGTGYDGKAAEAIRQRLRERLGPVEVMLEPVEQIPRGPNGKFRAVISKVAQEAAHGR